MNILIAGGAGFIGTYIIKRFEEEGVSVKLFSRAGIGVSWVF